MGKPTIVLNSGRRAARAAKLMLKRPEWQSVEQWRVSQHNEDEGHQLDL